MNKNYDPLVPHARKYPNGESEQAEALFNQFLSEGFSYDAISNHPDWPGYASAEFLLDLLPWMIDEMLRREDTVNYLIYPMLSAINLEGSEISEYQERSRQLIALADKSFAEKACQFLDALKDEPPIEQEDFDRVYNFWQGKLKELS